MGSGWSTPALGTHLPLPIHLAVALLLQSVEPVKRQPRSQCLSTLVRPVFGEVRARLGVLWGMGLQCPIYRVPCPLEFRMV